MPIEIRELNIKTFINETPPPETSVRVNPGRLSPDERDDIIAACVERVIRLLNDKEER
jgi:hypothetical protein